MDFGRYLTVRRRQRTYQPKHTHNDDHDHLERKRLPWIESPVNEQIFEVLGSDGTPSLEKMKSRADSLASISTTGAPILYKTRHEASTIELFYDLFFVANLATFTTMHQHVDAECKLNPEPLAVSTDQSAAIISYEGFFTLLWFTWLSTTLYDVRFTTDSVVERLFKCVHFGIMIAFVFCGKSSFC